jgi:transcriptional regulator with XRE-family HTH domain
VSTFSKLWIKLRNKAYRHAFVATQLKRGIPFQFRVMRKKLGLSQADVARLAGVSQGVISRAEDSDYGNLTFNNVLRIAAGLDVAFVGRLVPFSDLARWFDNLSEESVQVPTFEEEDQRLEGLGTTFDIHPVSAAAIGAGAQGWAYMMLGQEQGNEQPDLLLPKQNTGTNKGAERAAA